MEVQLTDYDPASCVLAGELRGMGMVIPGHVPDAAWVPRSCVVVTRSGVFQEPGGLMCVVEFRITGPFRWVSVSVDVKDPGPGGA